MCERNITGHYIHWCLAFPSLPSFFLFYFISEEREIPSPQRSKWHFRAGSSWERGRAGSRLLGAVEGRRCSDGSAPRGRPGTVCGSAWRPPDASSQRHDLHSGCSHPWSLAGSISAAPFRRWEVHLPIYLTKTAHLLSVAKFSPWCLHLNVVCFQRTSSLSLCSCGSESSMPDTNPWILTTSPQCQPTLLITYLQGRIWKYGQISFPLYFSLNGLGWKLS